MITYSIIQKSQLEGAARIDPEYYQPEYLQHSNNLKNFILENLSKLTSKIDVGFVSSMVSHFQNEGIPLLRTQNVQEFLVEPENDVVYIDEGFHNKLKKSQVFPGYLLLARSGSIGNVGVVPNKFPIANSADIILIKVSTDKLIPEFLAAFLNSKYGKFQVERGSSGGLQGHINLYSLEKLQVPIIRKQFQEEVKNLVLSGLNLIEESKQLYDQAEDLLLEELGLKDFRVVDDLSFIVNLSDVKSANRVDPDFFQPKYEAIVAHFRKLARPLKNIAPRSTKFVKIYPDTEYRYIEISDIDTGNGAVTSNIIMGRDLPANAKMQINGGELIISKVRPTRGAVGIIPDQWKENFVASGAFSVFAVNYPQREYLQVVLRSLIGKLQLERPTTGTSYPTVTDEDVENLLIPILPKETQQKIADLVLKSHEARKKSKELLEEAKRKVEEMIEKG